MIKRKPLELPPEVGRALQAFHREPNAIKKDEIASRTLRLLREHYPRKLRLVEIKRLFELMR